MIETDLNDRDFPKAIGSESRLSISFTESEFSITEAFSKLEELNISMDLGLVKIAPDLAENGDGQIFVALKDGDLPDHFTWFSGGKKAQIVDKDRLAFSYPDGVYLVTGNTTHLAEFEDTLNSDGVEVKRWDDSILDSLIFVVLERGFTIVLLASFALISSLALFWLSARAISKGPRSCTSSSRRVPDYADTRAGPNRIQWDATRFGRICNYGCSKLCRCFSWLDVYRHLPQSTH